MGQYKELWRNICWLTPDTPNPNSNAQCIGDAEDNANATMQEKGFDQFSEEWYKCAIDTYEFLVEL